MHIALISEHASPLAALGGVDAGGQNIYVAEVARQLGRRGHRVDVFTRRDNPLSPPVVDWQKNVRVVHVDAGPARFVAKEDMLPLMPDFSRALIAFAAQRSEPYDIAHANFFMSGMAAEKLQAALGTPFVITFHALAAVRRRWQREQDRFPICRHAIEKRLMRSARRVIAECPQDLDDMFTLCAADPARTAIAPCGYDPRQFHPIERRVARRILGWDQDEFAVLQLGRLVPRKGIDNAIKGLAASLDRGVKSTRLYVVGGNSRRPDVIATPEIGRLERVATEAGVAERVKFLGRSPRDVLSVFYSAADVFVTTPWYEPFGITPVEAMACGVPVIGARVGGIQHTVHDGVTGLLVPPEDPLALGHALARLYHDPELRHAMGQAGQRRAAGFTWSHVVDTLLPIYDAARGNGGAGRTAHVPHAFEAATRPPRFSEPGRP